MNPFSRVQNNHDKHYESISSKYDKLYTFDSGYYTWLSNRISIYLNIKQKDIFVDLGGGTGHISTAIHKQNSMMHDALCVDPNQQMLNAIKNQSHVIPYCCDALSFSKDKKIKYDKILLASMVHHLEKRSEIFNGLHNQLNNHGRILISTRPPHTSLPFFNSALKTFQQSQTAYEHLTSELESAGFSVATHTEKRVINIPRAAWYRMLKERFMSNLIQLSNQEIEDGIEELELKYRHQEIIPAIDTITFFSGHKQ